MEWIGCQVLKAWALSSWPKGGGELGMERSSYCRRGLRSLETSRKRARLERKIAPFRLVSLAFRGVLP